MATFALWYANGDARAMLHISEHNGGLAYHGGNLVQERDVIIWLLFVSLAISATALLLRVLPPRERQERLAGLQIGVRESAGVLAAQAGAIGALITLQLGLGGSWYGVAKWMPILLTESVLAGVLLVVTLTSLVLTRSLRRTLLRWFGASIGRALLLPRSRPAMVLLVVGFFAAVLLSHPLLEAGTDQTPLITAREVLLANADELASVIPDGHRLYPQTSLGASQNYYLAIGVIGFPRDDRTMKWYLESQTGGEEPLPPALPGGAVWDTEVGSTCIFAAGSGWHGPEQDGDKRWHWSKGDADLVVISSEVGTLKVDGRLMSWPRPNTVSLGLKDAAPVVTTFGEQMAVPLSATLPVAYGRSVLALDSGRDAAPEAVGNRRNLAVGLENPVVSVNGKPCVSRW
jgi:hypothetical protein